jgi:hypothetical protein
MAISEKTFGTGYKFGLKMDRTTCIRTWPIQLTGRRPYTFINTSISPIKEDAVSSPCILPVSTDGEQGK